MSRTIKRNVYTSAKKVDARPFCGVCQKAGKPESVYRGHFTKSKPGSDGVVICPTILSIECRFCHEKGHSASEEHCPALREKKLRRKEWEKEDRIQKKKQKESEEMKKNVVVIKKTLTNNRFAQAFEVEDSDDEEEIPVKMVSSSSVPIVIPKPVCESVRKFSYASMLKRETPLIETQVIHTYTDYMPLVIPKIAKCEPEPISKPDPVQKIEPKIPVPELKMGSKPFSKKIEALKEYYKPIPIDLENDDKDDEFAFDVNFMSKNYVSNDAW